MAWTYLTIAGLLVPSAVIILAMAGTIWLLDVALRLVSIGLIVAGIAGLKLAS